MPDPAQVIAADNQFFQSLVAADVSTLTALLHDDFLLVDLSGALSSKSAMLTAIRSGALRFDGIDPREQTVRFFESTAIVTGQTEMSGQLGNTSFAFTSRYTHVFVEREGAWLFVSAQGTPVADG
jgi:ketosteroid isomerase-like protein